MVVTNSIGWYRDRQIDGSMDRQHGGGEWRQTQFIPKDGAEVAKANLQPPSSPLPYPHIIKQHESPNSFRGCFSDA